MYKGKKVSHSAPARPPAAKTAVKKTEPIQDAKGRLMGSRSLNEGKVNVPTTGLVQQSLPLALEAPKNSRVDVPTRYSEAYRAYERVKSNGIPDLVKDFTQSMNDSMDDIWFSFIDPTIKEETFITLKDYMDGLVSSGVDTLDLCGQIAESWNNELARDYPGWSIETVVLKYQTYNLKSKLRYANILRDPNGIEWVIDYSAKQYDPRAPFPLIQPFPLWRAWVNKHGEEHGDEPNGMDRYSYSH